MEYGRKVVRLLLKNLIYERYLQNHIITNFKVVFFKNVALCSNFESCLALSRSNNLSPFFERCLRCHGNDLSSLILVWGKERNL